MIADSAVTPVASLSLRFLGALNGLGKILNRAGISHRVVDRADGQLSHFPRLSPEAQAQHLEEIERFVASSDELIEIGESPQDSPALAWQVLRKMGFGPKFDFFDLIVQGDVLEAYDSNQRPVFRNLDYYRYTSHSLESIFTLSWYELGKRDPKIEERIFADVSHVYSNNLDKSLTVNVEPHIFEEIDSPELMRTKLHIKHLVPLHRDGKVAAILGITRVELLSRI